MNVLTRLSRNTRRFLSWNSGPDPLSHRWLVRGCLASAALVLATIGHAGSESEQPPLNRLTPEEKADGWKLLFDGKTSQGWRRIGQPDFPARGWVIEDGILKKLDRVRGGNIITEGTYDNFDFKWEWKIPPRANNGIKYFIIEQRGSIGHEYQLIDDSRVGNPEKSTASFYDVLPPKEDKPLHPPGEWNSSRIIARGNHVEHWLNGRLVLEYEMGSERVVNGIKHSKFKDVKNFGTSVKGHILITDHGDEAWFRNLKIRELNPDGSPK